MIKKVKNEFTPGSVGPKGELEERVSLWCIFCLHKAYLFLTPHDHFYSRIIIFDEFTDLQIASANSYKGIGVFFKEFLWKICFWSAAKNASHIMTRGWQHLMDMWLTHKNMAIRVQDILPCPGHVWDMFRISYQINSSSNFKCAYYWMIGSKWNCSYFAQLPRCSSHFGTHFFHSFPGITVILNAID